jgi:hypothetical protein
LALVAEFVGLLLVWLHCEVCPLHLCLVPVHLPVLFPLVAVPVLRFVQPQL